MNETIFSDCLRNQVQSVTWPIIVYQCFDHPNHQDYQVSQPCLGLCGTKSGLSKTKVVIASQSQRKKQQFQLQPKKIPEFFHEINPIQ